MTFTKLGKEAVVFYMNDVIWCGMICYAKILYVMICHDMLWYAIICYDMLWYKCKRQDTVHTGSPGIHQATVGGNSSPQLSISKGHNKIWNNKIWNKNIKQYRRGLYNLLHPCIRDARKWRENEKVKRKWRENREMEREWGSGEIMRKWREIHSLHFLIFS